MNDSEEKFDKFMKIVNKIEKNLMTRPNPKFKEVL
ncbi:hypothetical protein ES703_122564 [subsurface metagenome]